MITWADLLFLVAISPLAAIILARGFRYLIDQDAAEGRRNQIENCGYHRWTREAAGGLICATCGMVPGATDTPAPSG